MGSRSLVLLLVALLAGCATRFENAPLPAGRSENPERRVVDRENEPDRPVILMAFSGGGSRAAMLALSILRELRDTSYTQDGRTRPLIGDVALVSSVSGGSVTAAHFGLHGAAGLDALETDFLSQDNISTLFWRAVNPINWFRYGFSGRSRIGILEDLFDERFVKGARFETLNQPGKPFVILNATDMASGEVFALTPQRFDDVCSDFDQQPVSVGIAASAPPASVLPEAAAGPAGYRGLYRPRIRRRRLQAADREVRSANGGACSCRGGGCPPPGLIRSPPPPARRSSRPSTRRVCG